MLTPCSVKGCKMKEQKEMLKKYKKLKKEEEKILKKGELSEEDASTLFNLRQDMSMILDFIYPQQEEY